MTAERRANFGSLNSPFARSRNFAVDQTELLLARDLAPLQSIEAPELAPIAEPFPFENPAGFPIRDELKYSNFNNLAFLIGAASSRVLNSPKANTRRTYLAIFNTHAANNLFVTFGQDSTLAGGVPILANFGFFEFNNVVPQDDIFLIASGAGTTGVILYANDSINVQST